MSAAAPSGAARLRSEIERHHASAAVRLRSRLVGMPVLGRLARALARLAAER